MPQLQQRLIERADGSFEIVLEGPGAERHNDPAGWVLHHPLVQPSSLGWLPCFLDPNDPRSAREQLDEGYAHGGGWRPRPGWRMCGTELCYEDDKSLQLLASFALRHERILLFEHAWVAIVQPDGTFECCRMN